MAAPRLIPIATTTIPISSPPRLLRKNSSSCIPPYTPQLSPRSVANFMRGLLRIHDVQCAGHAAVAEAAAAVRAEERVLARGQRDQALGRRPERKGVEREDGLAGLRVHQGEAVRPFRLGDAERDLLVR